MKGQKIFLLDAAGAVVSVLFLSLLYSFNEFFGVPQSLLRVFIFIALALASYSFTVYFVGPANWQLYLTIIGILNLTYCFYTVYGLVQYAHSVTLYGHLYFVGEVLVVLGLAAYELRLARKKRILG
jgi:hypothetical protein